MRAEKRSSRKLRINRPVFLTIIGLILLVTAVRLWGPVARARRLEAENARLRAQIKSAKTDHARLEEEKRRLASDTESVVRRDGYLKEGERSLVFVPGKDEEATGEEAKRRNGPATATPDSH